MKKLLFLLIYCLIIGVGLSCSGSDDDPGFQYQGSWSGTYSGDNDNGSITASISASGAITGSAKSNVYNETYNISGNVTIDGDFRATAGTTTSNTIFEGTLKGNSGNGTWSNSSTGYSGMWSTRKD